jgi:hypothetical protein
MKNVAEVRIFALLMKYEWLIQDSHQRFNTCSNTKCKVCIRNEHLGIEAKEEVK